MKVTFVLIAYNEAANIANCINSILAQNQLTDFEIIIVNDDSKDETAKIVRDIAQLNRRIKLINLETNRGRGFARATGLENAKGKLLAFVDADIILPPNWYDICLRNLKDNDAVGGIAVPDGDICYIFNTFKLKPKIVLHPTLITGNNGLYKKEIFDRVHINKQLRDGEDVDYNNRLVSYGFKLFTIKDLLVTHIESKGFYDSLLWLYQSGKGATRQLKRFKRVRLPDVAYFGFLSCILFSFICAYFLKAIWFLLLIPSYPLLSSWLHIRTKFYFSLLRIWQYVGAIGLNYPLIFSYYMGRTVGLGTRGD